MTEIFEYRMMPESLKDMQHACRELLKASHKIPGLKKMTIYHSKENPGTIWQIFDWENQEVVKAGFRAYMSLPEANGISAFMLSPPKRVGDFEIVS